MHFPAAIKDKVDTESLANGMDGEISEEISHKDIQRL